MSLEASGPRPKRLIKRIKPRFSRVPWESELAWRKDMRAVGDRLQDWYSRDRLLTRRYTPAGTNPGQLILIATHKIEWNEIKIAENALWARALLMSFHGVPLPAWVVDELQLLAEDTATRERRIAELEAAKADMVDLMIEDLCDTTGDDPSVDRTVSELIASDGLALMLLSRQGRGSPPRDRSVARQFRCRRPAPTVEAGELRLSPQRRVRR